MSVSEKRSSIYTSLLTFAAGNNSSLTANTCDLNSNDNRWFVDVKPINEYLKRLKTTLNSIKEIVEKEKNSTAKNKSRSLKIISDLLKLIPNNATASEDFLNDAEALSKKLKRIGRLSFLGSFGASLNYGKSIELLNSCGFF